MAEVIASGAADAAPPRAVHGTAANFGIRRARPKETDALIDLLLKAGGSPVAITTRCAPAASKTTLAAAICQDDRVLDAFDDGILW
jgi:hypothetical protein